MNAFRRLIYLLLILFSVHASDVCLTTNETYS